MHVSFKTLVLVLVLVLILLVLGVRTASARPPIRADFFALYTQAAGTQLDQLPSDSKHCGVCHFDFAGGGARNPYGLAIEVRINGGMTNTQAMLDIQALDSDNDGFSNLQEITDLLTFSNTPTFSGLSAANVGGISNIPSGEVTPYLTPMGATDTIPPTVVVISPDGGELIPPNLSTTVFYNATDASGISHVDIWFSDDSGATWKRVAKGAAPGGSFSWYVPNLPGPNSRIRVVAFDTVGNPGTDDSDADFTVETFVGGIVPTTLRDMTLPGTQPFGGAVLDDPADCLSCHANYNTAVEPGFNWKGSMMAQAARDPLFWAAVAVAEQDAPGAGDLCIRCHSPGGWQEGRSTDTGGGMLTAKDREGVQCDFCHRAVDPVYEAGVSPVQDLDVLAALTLLPLGPANGEFISDPNPLRRGPYADAQAAHAFVESPFHRESDMCGTCHDVSSPVFEQVGPGDYAPGTLDQEHPDFDLRNMFPIERTYSEWTQSEYATTGVYAPQFAGAKPDGIVSTCQDCHMRDVTGRGSNVSGSPNRTDLALHDMTGGNTFIPEVLEDMFPELDDAALDSGMVRARSMLRMAATLEVTPTETGITVRVTNETGHKLPSGYPEGRRIWLSVRAFQADGTTVYTSGHYDFATADLTHDEDAKIYEIHPGLSPALAGALGFPAGKSFHFVLNDTIYLDNRIPPRGFTNAAFEAIQSPPVAYPYADGQYWDDTDYDLPSTADSVSVILYYQTLSKEYVTFLRDANETNSAGDDLYAAWESHGKSTPEVMASMTVAVDPAVTGTPGTTVPVFALLAPSPNPSQGRVEFAFAVPARERAVLRLYDVQGRLRRTLVDETVPAGETRVSWDGDDGHGIPLASGLYFLRLEAGDRTAVQRVIRLR